MTIKPESFNLPDWVWEALDPGVQTFYISWEKEQQEIAATNSPDPNKPVVGMEFCRADDLLHDGSPIVGIDAVLCSKGHLPQLAAFDQRHHIISTDRACLASGVPPRTKEGGVI